MAVLIFANQPFEIIGNLPFALQCSDETALHRHFRHVAADRLQRCRLVGHEVLESAGGWSGTESLRAPAGSERARVTSWLYAFHKVSSHTDVSSRSLGAMSLREN